MDGQQQQQNFFCKTVAVDAATTTATKKLFCNPMILKND